MAVLGLRSLVLVIIIIIIIILRKYPGLDYQKLANYYRDAGKL